MAIFGDVNDNRVIPLLLLSGIVFITGMYFIYFYKWIKSLLGCNSVSKIHIQTELAIPFDSLVHKATDKVATVTAKPSWESESTILVFQQSIHRPAAGVASLYQAASDASATFITRDHQQQLPPLVAINPLASTMPCNTASREHAFKY